MDDRKRQEPNPILAALTGRIDEPPNAWVPDAPAWLKRITFLNVRWRRLALVIQTCPLDGENKYALAIASVPAPRGMQRSRFETDLSHSVLTVLFTWCAVAISTFLVGFALVAVTLGGIFALNLHLGHAGWSAFGLALVETLVSTIALAGLALALDKAGSKGLSIRRVALQLVLILGGLLAAADLLIWSGEGSGLPEPVLVVEVAVGAITFINLAGNVVTTVLVHRWLARRLDEYVIFQLLGVRHAVVDHRDDWGTHRRTQLLDAVIENCARAVEQHLADRLTSRQPKERRQTLKREAAAIAAGIREHKDDLATQGGRESLANYTAATIRTVIRGAWLDLQRGMVLRPLRRWRRMPKDVLVGALPLALLVIVVEADLLTNQGLTTTLGLISAWWLLVCTLPWIPGLSEKVQSMQGLASIWRAAGTGVVEQTGANREPRDHGPPERVADTDSVNTSN